MLEQGVKKLTDGVGEVTRKHWVARGGLHVEQHQEEAKSDLSRWPGIGGNSRQLRGRHSFRQNPVSVSSGSK